MAPNETTLVFIEVFCLFLGISGCILIKLDRSQPDPYMDEVFHIPQVQKYCHGQFQEWDPMITTLPGLYIIAVGILKPISFFFGISMKTLCSPLWLRLLNVSFACGNFYLLYLLLLKLHGKGVNRYRTLWTALALSICPVLYFFSFLFYTDSGAVFSVLLMYLLSLQGSHVMAAMMGALAVLFRQTNVVWVVFVAGSTAIQPIIAHMRADKKGIRAASMTSFDFLSVLARHYVTVARRNPQGLADIVVQVMTKIWAYVAVVMAFVAFVALNGGIVVGAKDAHQAGLHVPQLLYFAAFSAAFSFIHLASLANIKGFLHFVRQRPMICVAFLMLSGIAVWKLTFAHKYLLADNRHYTFYLWSRVFARHTAVKYLLIPGYLVACWGLHNAVRDKDILWKLVFTVCVIVNLVPSMLLELRYFLIPYLILRVNMPLSCSRRLALEVAACVVINVATLYMFTERPFFWPGSTDKQRFMW